MKKAISYLRFSSDDQSQHSIERQEMVITNWAKYNDVALQDSFIDKGVSARTFDRPDVKQLFEFIRKNHRQIDYLIVSELTRFSRETGGAITMVRKIQTEYGIRIVSANRSQVYDIYDPNSFFMMGLEFLLGNSENIKRTNDINGGIYTAKAQKGLWVQGGRSAPYGYIKQGQGDMRRLIIQEDEATIVRFIFASYLENVPIYIIRMDAKDMGFKKRGHDAIHEILKNPIYIGYQQVKAWKDLPGGLFPLKEHPSIVDTDTWHKVQEKIQGPKYKRLVEDALPLRGVLKCHCQGLLTGAASLNKVGKPYHYYKCNKPRHNNISAARAHQQLQEILKLLSLPDYMITLIREESDILMKQNLAENRKKLRQAQAELTQLEKELQSVEKKFINEELSAETFHRWHQRLTETRVTLRNDIEKWSRDEQETWYLLDQELEKLTDLQSLYNDIPIPAKQELIRQVFDNSLYYQEKVYRTPFIMEAFSLNLLTLKEKQLLILDKMDYRKLDNPVRWS